MPDIDAISARYFGGLTSGDVEACLACYTPDGVLWHNFDEADRGLEALRASLTDLFQTIHDRKFTSVRRHPTPTGFVEQYVFDGRTTSGAPVHLAAVFVFTLKGDLVQRAEEYLDTAALAAMSA